MPSADHILLEGTEQEEIEQSPVVLQRFWSSSQAEW